ncbi:MAG: hydroxymethylbilane synthase [Bacteroidetes bacterium GWF2_42_66]|nr:MAG: hydroxymethylbilane synthase [Bacteroidetes bacterium GWA2_42_15]OFX97477.1 MAG: hydroxymethylbilane synthase [Bacteroidetes bacterium GWE2_42_39]OFY43828.1 MAG: hydroxymethylbilane synthase [Bacteroidetes bacterium GWF2_42_66]HBL76186.1 hydroxymethylbilane synthase [Prolixibacteraceae bacterium]HCU60424.1 hydroxymethylbilane synthase [Prolixibacteraceae bacterium]
MDRKVIKIGTRGSKLALWQANEVQKAIRQVLPELQTEIVVMNTPGDLNQTVSLMRIEDAGFFTKDIEDALLQNEIDMAVHSMKDMPVELPERLIIGGALLRGDVRDVLITRDGRKFAELTAEDKIGTCSLRRKAQLLHLNPQLQVTDIRGNVDVRIQKMLDGDYDALVIAAAGVERLGLAHHISEYFSPADVCPAPCQAAIAIEIAKDNAFIQEIVDRFSDDETLKITTAERNFLRCFDDGSQTPAACYSEKTGEEWRITGVISSVDGSRLIKKSISGSIEQAPENAVVLAQQLLNSGGKEILEQSKEQDNSLTGKIIITTHSRKPHDELEEFLRKRGATVISMPTIEILPIAFDLPEPIASYHWIVFTSPNAIQPFFSRVKPMKNNRLAVLGPGTAKALEDVGYTADFTGSGNSAIDFADEWIPQLKPGERILLALGELAPDMLQQKLADNFIAGRVNVYHTVLPQKINEASLDRIKNDRYDLLTVSSPSAIKNLCFLLNEKTPELRIISIGQTSTMAIRKLGMEPLATAANCSCQSLAETCINYLEKQNNTIPL